MIIQYEFAGHLTKVQFHGGIIGTGIGHHFHGIFAYETNTARVNNQFQGPGFDLAAQIYTNGTVDNLNLTYGLGAYAMLNQGVPGQIHNPPFPPPSFGIQQQGSISTYWGIWMGDNTGSLITGPNLPSQLPPLAKWDKKLFWYANEGSGFLLGEVDTLFLVLPPRETGSDLFSGKA